jgi:lipoyl(octanoyl) transferase
MSPAPSPALETAGTTLRAYLLGSVGFDAALGLQRSLVYETAGDRGGGALVVCDHPPLITVGREGGPADIRFAPEELRTRRWPVRWVNRGGGCLLHLPGQMLIYPVLPLDRYALGLEAYLDRLGRVVLAVLDDFSVHGELRQGEAGVWVGPRMIAGVGVAVWNWVAYFGVALNLDPDLAPFRHVRTGGPDDGPMTSLARERRGPVRPSLVRERLLEHFAAAFGFRDTALFFNHRLLDRASAPGEVTSRR